jgi:hypothetical protein
MIRAMQMALFTDENPVEVYMSRSVNVPSGSAGVIYFPFGDVPEENMFQDLVCNLRCIICAADSRFYIAEGYMGREGKIIAKSNIAFMVLSEYCGLCSLAIVPNDEADEEVWEPLKKNWEDFSNEWSSTFIDKLRDILLKNGWDIYKKIGTFSNGEGVFQRLSA